MKQTAEALRAALQEAERLERERDQEHARNFVFEFEYRVSWLSEFRFRVQRNPTEDCVSRYNALSSGVQRYVPNWYMDPQGMEYVLIQHMIVAVSGGMHLLRTHSRDISDRDPVEITADEEIALKNRRLPKSLLLQSG